MSNVETREIGWIARLLMMVAALLATATACDDMTDATDNDVAGATQAVVGGEVASEPVYDAVMCMPRYGTGEHADSGWAQTIARCVESMTLITPNMVIGERQRLITQTHPFLLGALTTNGAPANDLSRRTAFEVGVAVNAIDDGPRILRRATGCLEMRRSGLAPCCKHPYAGDPDLATLEYAPPTRSALQRAYIPPADLLDVPFDDPRHEVEVSSEYRTYRDYLSQCVEPLAPNDDVVSNIVFFRLGERIDESDVTPIPLALRYPDGSRSPEWFSDSGAAGDIVGFGGGRPGATADGGRYGIRRVARAATVLAPSTELVGSSYNGHSWVFPPDGSAVRIYNNVFGDGGRGASHVDFGAPWLFDDGSGLKVYAVAIDGLVWFDVPYAVAVTPDTADYLDAFFDPDGDGLLRGFADGHLSDRIDADGDGLSEARVDPTSGARIATRNDNCAPPDGADADTAARYTNPTQADIDGDGVGDVCDVCPSVYDPEQSSCVAVRAATAESSPTGVALTPGDLVGTACVRRGAYDRDGDGVLDVCDNCVGEAPGVTAFNPDQRDDDGDGIGNTCDVCPDDPDPTRSDASTGDLDGDGVGDACGDNCVGVRNPDQANCNVDAELVAGLASIAGERIVGGVGDACDPTPCGETRLGLVSEVVAGGAFGAGSRVAATRALQVDGRSTNAQEARTGFRFCRCDLAEADDVSARLACQLDLESAGGNCGIAATVEYDAALADTVDEADLTWRFTSVGGMPSAPALNTEINTSYAFNLSRPDFDPSLETRWDLEADAQRWASVFGDVAPPGGLTWTLPGVLWTHTPGGATSTASVFEPAVRVLSTHYWSGGVSRVEAPREAPGCVRYAGPLTPSRGCPLCEAAFPTPFLGLPHTDRFCRDVPRPPTLVSPGLDLDLRDFLPVDPRDPAPLDWPELLTREDLLWVAASEPGATRPAVSEPRAGLRLVAVDERGQPVVRVRDGARGLVADGHDFGSPCVPGQCEVVTPPFACGQGGPCPSDATLGGSITESQRFANASGGVTPSSNGRRTYVLSSRREVLFSVRGDRLTRSGSVSSTRLLADGSSDVFDDRSVALGRVLAATYEPIHDVLYVLDEVEERRGWRIRRHARLARVGLHGAPQEDATAVLPVEVVAEWPRLGSTTRFALSPGVDGTLWLVASGRAAHTVLRLDASSPVLRTLGVTIGAGALAEVPVAVDDRGLSYVTEDLVGRASARGVRVRDLRVPRGAEVSSCF